MTDPHRNPDRRVSDPSLESLQQWFQAVISHPEGVVAGESSDAAAAALGPGAGIDELLTPSHSLDAASRLSVYADAYFARLIECLGEVFPMMRRLLGAEVFDGFAFEFLQESPSRTYTLHHLGRGFPDWLQSSRARAEFDAGRASDPDAPDWPDLLVDLARLEWAIYEVFDGPGIEGQPALRADAFDALAPDRLAAARLTLAPCVRVLAFRFPVNDLFSTLRQSTDEDDVSMPSPGPSWLAINRRRFVVHRHPLDRPAHALLESIAHGRSLEVAIDAAASLWSGSDDAFASALHAWFDDWAANDFFLAVESPSDAPPSDHF